MRFDTQIRRAHHRSRHVPCCLAHTTSSAGYPSTIRRAEGQARKCAVLRVWRAQPSMGITKVCTYIFFVFIFLRAFFFCHTFADKLLQAAAPPTALHTEPRWGLACSRAQTSPLSEHLKVHVAVVPARDSPQTCCELLWCGLSLTLCDVRAHVVVADRPPRHLTRMHPHSHTQTQLWHFHLPRLFWYAPRPWCAPLVRPVQHDGALQRCTLSCPSCLPL
jgi:hypothetical protein